MRGSDYTWHSKRGEQNESIAHLTGIRRGKLELTFHKNSNKVKLQLPPGFLRSIRKGREFDRRYLNCVVPIISFGSDIKRWCRDRNRTSKPVRTAKVANGCYGVYIRLFRLRREVLVRLDGYDWVPETKLTRSLRSRGNEAELGRAKHCWQVQL